MNITKRDMRYFEVAKAVAKTSEYKRVHIGCIIVSHKNIIAVGVNQIKSSPIQAKYNKKYRGFYTKHNYIHAELHAILSCGDKEINGANMYIYRQLNTGELGCCKPCPGCERLIKEYSIKYVYFINKSGEYERMKF
jgi:deoxycytidylate deaminase